MDRIIEVKVNGNYLSKDGCRGGVQGEANVTILCIEFDAGWDGFTKSVTFRDALGENPTKILLGAEHMESERIYLCPIPGEALTEAGWFTFIIEGAADNKRQRVEDKLIADPAGTSDNANAPADPTPSQAEQLQAQIDSLRKAIENGGGSEGGGGGTGSGEDGEDGGYYIPSVSDTGELTWAGSKADMPGVPAANIKGPKGDKGEKGDPGKDGEDGADGAPGANGYTPVKGVDYYTDAEKAALVEDVAEAVTPTAITAISVTEASNGNVTITNTLEGGATETITITADANGNPKTVNGIPITWTEAS